jgi:hypothetical protein
LEHFTNNCNLTIQIRQEFANLIKKVIGLELNPNKILYQYIEIFKQENYKN